MSGGTSTTREVRQQELLSLFLCLIIFVLTLNPLTPLFRGVLRAGRVPAPRLLGLLRRVWLRIRRRVALGGLRRGRDQVPSSLVITFLLNHQYNITTPPQVLGVPTLQVAGGGPGLPLLHAALLRLPAPPRLPPAAAEREAAGLQAEAEDGARAGGRAAEAENRLQKQCIRWQRVQFAGKIEPLLELALKLNLY